MTPTDTAGSAGQDRITGSAAGHPALPLDEQFMAALQEAGFDESDVDSALGGMRRLIEKQERIKAERDDAMGAITDAVLLIQSFDPSCGTARTRTFIADLEHLLRGRP